MLGILMWKGMEIYMKRNVFIIIVGSDRKVEHGETFLRRGWGRSDKASSESGKTKQVSSFRKLDMGIDVYETHMVEF